MIVKHSTLLEPGYKQLREKCPICKNKLYELKWTDEGHVWVRICEDKMDCKNHRVPLEYVFYRKIYSPVEKWEYKQIYKFIKERIGKIPNSLNWAGERNGEAVTFFGRKFFYISPNEGVTLKHLIYAGCKLHKINKKSEQAKKWMKILNTRKALPILGEVRI